MGWKNHNNSICSQYCINALVLGLRGKCRSLWEIRLECLVAVLRVE